MSKIKEAAEILRSLGLPRAQQNERSALTLLALARVNPKGSWRRSTQPLLRIWDIMSFMRDQYGKDYAANSRETIRRQTIHQFEQARLVDRNPDDPSRPTNSGNTVYALTDRVVSVLRSYGTRKFEAAVGKFIKDFSSLQEDYSRRRKRHAVPLRLPDGTTVNMSPGTHNALQVKVIELFGPRFAPNAVVLYVGDTARKHIIFEEERLQALGVPITEHDKLPDIVLYWEGKNWLFLIEAVTSHGPVSPKRHREIEKMLAKSPAERVYVTAFLGVRDFRKYSADIAWETEVWLADNPDHMIHFNGPKFLGPYRPTQ